MKISGAAQTHTGLLGVGGDDHHNAAHIAAFHSDQAATGAELNELTDGSESVLHKHAPDGMILEGSNLTEATTVSASAVDLLSVTGLSIPAATPILIICSIRRTAAGGNALIGLKLNATEVRSIETWDGVSEAMSALYIVWVGSRVANYLRSGYARVKGAGSAALFSPLDTDLPTATITDVVIRAAVGASSTVGAATLRVYSLPA